MAQPLSPSVLRLAAVSRLVTGERVRALLVAGSTFGLLVGAGAANGGYYPGAWGWLTLAAAWIASLALVLDRPLAVSRAGLTTLALLTAFAGWTLASVLWSVDVTQTALEAQRVLVYVAGFGAMLLLARRGWAALLGGAWAAVLVLSAYALATRLVPDRFGVVDQLAGNRLAEPIGYWNSLGLLATLGALLALGLATRGPTTWMRIAAAGSLPLLVLTLYFTYSRGAWVSLFAGLVVLVAVDRRRLHTLALLAAAVPWSAVAVAVAWHFHSLTSANPPPLALQAHDGHRLALLLVLLAAGASATSAAAIVFERRVAISASVQRRVLRALALAAVVSIVVLFGTFGTPLTLATRAWHGFASTPPAGAPAAQTTLNSHLFQVSGSGRIDEWRLAWHHEVAAHPSLGTGAATYERYYQRYRTGSGKVRNVHNLYLEVVATLGPVGLLLLLSALGAPLVSAIRSRGRPLVPAALAVVVAYLLHALVDWDWQITAVTLVMLAAAASLYTDRTGELSRWGRGIGIAAALTVGGLAVWGIAMQTALGRIQAAADNPARAASATQTAADLQPWSTEPWQRLAEIQIETRRFAGARDSLRHALAEDPRDWSLWFDLARASVGTTRAHALERATQLNPNSPEIAAFRAALASLATVGAKP